jgi:hypothetical protein
LTNSQVSNLHNPVTILDSTTINFSLTGQEISGSVIESGISLNNLGEKSYNSLTDKPNIPSAQIQSDWNQTNNSSLDYIKNKPTIPTVITSHSELSNLGYADSGHTGFEPTLTKGNLTESTSSILTISNGINAVIGSGTSIQVSQATTSTAGYLSSTDWNTFNNKVNRSGDTMAGDLNFTGKGINTADYINLNNLYTHTGSEPIGSRFWNTTKGTTSLITSANSTLDDGQEVRYYVKASGDILNGELVQFSAWQGDHYTAKKAVPAEIIANPMLLMGIATENISNGSFGNITHFGEVTRGTTGWSVDDLLYFDNSTGQLTNVEPTAPSRRILIAAVIKEETSAPSANGIILVRLSWGSKLEELEDVDGSAPNATGDLLSWNNTGLTWERNAYNITDYATLSSLTFTAGSIPFAGATGLLTQDNDGFSYDDTGNFLKITSTAGKQLRLAYSDAVYSDFVQQSGGSLQITPTGAYIYSGKSLFVNSDTRYLIVGAGGDLRISYNGTKGVIDSGYVAPSDIHITTGVEKTLVLDTPVYDDFLPSVSVLATGGASPDTTNHTIQGVIGSYYSFDGGATEERLTIKIELLHGYKEGSDIEIHVHTMPSTTGSGNVIWYFDYFYSPVNAASIAGGTLSATQTIAASTQYNDYTTTIGIISGTGRKIGDFIIGTLRRTPSGAGDTYGADMLLKRVAAHAELDTTGSRQRYVK